MIHFECDYTEGCHPAILQRLVETNEEQTTGYGMDEHCENARALIRNLCEAPDADVHFLVGGTQTNTTVIASILRPYQGVLCAETGHINVHETGAIEATGHKVLPLKSSDGKITAGQIREAYDAHWNDHDHEHIVQPGLVYLSQSTENGTIYSKAELTAISQTCHDCKLPLFLDGARLGYALASPENDLTLADIARLCDVFYIGGTKVGALFGEAVVITNPAFTRDFRYLIKQHGGMLAKGRLLGIQFETLMEGGDDCLYFQISNHAVKLAYKIKEAIVAKGYDLLYDSPTNQQYPILPDEMVEKLSKEFSFAVWSKVDDKHTAVRFCTSWATRKESVDTLIQKL
ncbi:MAG TPA: low specificity L-threonine aldolase [Candidatus Pelethocola excrementipullorum]|nr:low specificity L-threonine aldolase [Candidatus Pelethocola excrementipullorum]